MSRLASPNFLDLKTNKVERAPFERKFYQKLFELSFTSQDRPNSVPYQRLENSKRTSKCLKNTKRWTELVRRGPASWPRRVKRGDPFALFNIHCCKISKNLRGTLW